MKINIFIIFTFAIFTNFSCVVIKELIPKAPSPSFLIDEINKIKKTDLMDKDDIGMEYFYIKGASEPHTPPNVQPTKKLKEFLLDTQGIVDLNRSGIVRYYNLKEQKKVSRIIIMVPGIYSGAGTLSNLAFSLKRRIKDSEVWIWERRANQLEDRRIILKAIEKNDPAIFNNLYKKDSFKLKNKNDAFYQPSTEDISFLGYWGLNVLLEDLYYVIIEAKKRSDEMILAGYSLGVLYATMFLANDFYINDSITPGYKLIDKAILLDGPPIIDGYISNENMYDQGTRIIPNNIIEGRIKLESGKYYPASGSLDRDMSMFFNIDAQGAIAMIDPFSLSIETYDKKLPIDNLSKYLIQIDDNYQNFKLFTGTFGRADAKHTGIFSYTTAVKITGLTQGKDRISWIPRDIYDKNEYNDYKEYLKAANNKYFNMAEWYQPTRILLDMGSIHHNDTSSGWQKKYFNLTENKNINLPFLCVGLSRGLLTQITIYLNYKKLINTDKFMVVMINNITHLDGDTITDDESRPVVADVVTNWLSNKQIVETGSKNYNKALYYGRF